MIKHVICIQDISCFGKCSLTIALPILNVAKLHVTPLPTALLSTHTGGLGTPYIHDLHKDMKEIRNHWKSIPFPVKALYSGYASNQMQIAEIIALFQQYPNAFHLVDPVMGDHGKRYSSLPDDIEDSMSELCAAADMITPNMTEAYALLKEPYQAAPYTESELIRIVKKLSEQFSVKVLLTGASLNEQQLGCVCFEQNNAKILMSEYLPYQYHGSGDLFTASFLGAYLQGIALEQACTIAMHYTAMCLKYSNQAAGDERYGISFEPLLESYLQLCKESKKESADLRK